MRIISFAGPIFTVSLCIAAMAVAVSGCGPDGPVTYSVSGTVTVEGKAIESGTISFEDRTTGNSGGTDLKSGGSFNVQLQKGAYEVSVTPPLELVANSPETSPEERPRTDTGIADKYWAGDTSGLTLAIDGDVSGHEFKLE